MDLHNLAAPQVAGVAALILSSPEFYQYRPPRGSVASSIKQFIRGLSYQRFAFEPKVIWNGVNAYYCPRRRDNEPDQCSQPTTVTTTATVTVSLTNYYTLTSLLIVRFKGYHFYSNCKSIYLFTVKT